MALAKSQPGKFTYSSAGTGNGSHLTMELFRSAAGRLDMVHVPCKGGRRPCRRCWPAKCSYGGQREHVPAAGPSGKARALGVASSKRSPALPDVPTFKESGSTSRATVGSPSSVRPVSRPTSPPS